MKLSFILFTLLSLNYAICESYKNALYQQNVRFVRESYKFNHPPLVENDDSILVAVENGDSNNRKEKTLTSSEDKPKSTLKEQNSQIVRDATVSSNSSTQNHVSRDKVKEESVKEMPTNIHNELHIPVAVVYEAEPKILYTQRSEKSVDKRVNGVLKRGQRTEVNKANTNIKNAQGNISESLVMIKENNNSQTEVDNIKENVEEKLLSLKVNNYNNTNESTTKRSRQRDPVVPILEMKNYVYSHNGEFQYSYEGGDGTKAFEKGELKTYDDEKTGESVVGGFSYKDKDGNDFSLSYTADENGYRPIGAHLPTPPPIPPAIARALKYLATKTTPEQENITEKLKSI